jgi:hypothetical protein
MHRLPGIPSHDATGERNSNRAGRTRAVRMNEAGRAKRDEGGRARAARRHAKPPRVFVGVQEFIARLVGQGQ